VTITSSDEGVEIDHTDGINAYEALGMLVAAACGTLMDLFDVLDDDDDE